MGHFGTQNSGATLENHQNHEFCVPKWPTSQQAPIKKASHPEGERLPNLAQLSILTLRSRCGGISTDCGHLGVVA
jgi:hypothetical protein